MGKDAETEVSDQPGVFAQRAEVEGSKYCREDNDCWGSKVCDEGKCSYPERASRSRRSDDHERKRKRLVKDAETEVSDQPEVFAQRAEVEGSKYCREDNDCWGSKVCDEGKCSYPER